MAAKMQQKHLIWEQIYFAINHNVPQERKSWEKESLPSQKLHTQDVINVLHPRQIYLILSNLNSLANITTSANYVSFIVTISFTKPIQIN